MNKFRGYWTLFFILMIILVCQAGCSSTTVEPKEEVETEKKKAQRDQTLYCVLYYF